MDQVLLNRLVERFVATENGCWEWTSTKSDDGYGKIVIGWNNKHQPIRRYAHRVFYEIVYGELSRDLDIDHLCRNRSCVNPDHLEPVTRKENVNRGILASYMKRKAATRKYCKRGLHRYAGENIRKNGSGSLCRECRNQYKRSSYKMKKQNNPRPIIHGENAIIPIDAMPKGQVEKHTAFIIGHSETQHHHVLEAAKGFDILVQDGEIYFTNSYESKVVHKKSHDIHKTVTVAPGIYKVKRKTEYDPFEKVVREVWD